MNCESVTKTHSAVFLWRIAARGGRPPRTAFGYLRGLRARGGVAAGIIGRARPARHGTLRRPAGRMPARSDARGLPARGHRPPAPRAALAVALFRMASFFRSVAHAAGRQRPDRSRIRGRALDRAGRRRSIQFRLAGSRKTPSPRCAPCQPVQAQARSRARCASCSMKPAAA